MGLFLRRFSRRRRIGMGSEALDWRCGRECGWRLGGGLGIGLGPISGMEGEIEREGGWFGSAPDERSQSGVGSS